MGLELYDGRGKHLDRFSSATGVSWLAESVAKRPKLTCPPKTGPDFEIVFWDNLGCLHRQGLENRLIHHPKTF
jgi:hypothetical protein